MICSRLAITEVAFVRFRSSASDDEAKRAEDIAERYDLVNIDERAAQW